MSGFAYRGSKQVAAAYRWNGRAWNRYYEDPMDIVPDGEGGYWFGAQAILTGSTWTTEELPGFTGDCGDVTRIPGTTSFLRRQYGYGPP